MCNVLCFSMLADRFQPFGTTIFTEMTLLANKHSAVNLAQGFPDFDGPEFVKRAAIEAIGIDKPGLNQYARMFGLPPLNAALAANWQARTQSAIDPDTQICVTSGCTEAICAAMMGLINPGDEVILFEPYYDSYRASVAMARGICSFVTLHAPGATGSLLPVDERGNPNSFWFDPNQLRVAFSSGKVKAILLNTPHNPTGKVFTREELTLIADLCIQHNVVAITDEVYEHLTYDPALAHIHLATLPGMAERTLTLSSLGKSFSLTGWKIGWAIGPADLIKAVRAAHQFMTFATATPLQLGAAAAVGDYPYARGYVHDLVRFYADNRAFLANALRAVGFRVHEPAGAYFIMAEWPQLRIKGALLGDTFADDVAFCKHLTAEAGVAAIPPSVFYENKQYGKPLARFAFCKKRETLEEAARRLHTWAGIGWAGSPSRPSISPPRG